MWGKLVEQQKNISMITRFCSSSSSSSSTTCLGLFPVEDSEYSFARLISNTMAQKNHCVGRDNGDFKPIHTIRKRVSRTRTRSSSSLTCSDHLCRREGVGNKSNYSPMLTDRALTINRLSSWREAITLQFSTRLLLKIRPRPDAPLLFFFFSLSVHPATSIETSDAFLAKVYCYRRCYCYFYRFLFPERLTIHAGKMNTHTHTSRRTRRDNWTRREREDRIVQTTTMTTPSLEFS